MRLQKQHPMYMRGTLALKLMCKMCSLTTMKNAKSWGEMCSLLAINAKSIENSHNVEPCISMKYEQ